MRFSGKTAIVTGAAGGIGGAIARGFAQEGAALALIDRQPVDAKAIGGEAIAFQIDTTQRASVERHDPRHKREIRRHRHIGDGRGCGVVRRRRDACRSRVGPRHRDQPERRVPVRQAVIPAMRERRDGRIVNIGSIIGKNGGNARPWLDPSEQDRSSNIAYGASKAGVHALTLFLARELARDGITVNAVAPGPIKSAMTTAFPDTLKAAIPAGRMGTAEDVAEAVKFLASDAASFITGEIMDVNGGMLGD